METNKGNYGYKGKQEIKTRNSKTTEFQNKSPWNKTQGKSWLNKVIVWVHKTWIFCYFWSMAVTCWKEQIEHSAKKRNFCGLNNIRVKRLPSDISFGQSFSWNINSECKNNQKSYPTVFVSARKTLTKSDIKATGMHNIKILANNNKQ